MAEKTKQNREAENWETPGEEAGNWETPGEEAGNWETPGEEARNWETPGEEARNTKAVQLESYFQQQKLECFQKEELKDEVHTVIFHSAVEVEKQTLPMGIIVDDTIYTIIRVQIGSGLIKERNQSDFNEYMNELNRNYKVFKYISSDSGDIFLDACIPSTPEFFDPEMVRVVLNVIVEHLQEKYDELMKKAWA